MTSLNLKELPHAVLVGIIQFVGKVEDVLNCEKACRLLRDTVKDDRAWK